MRLVIQRVLQAGVTIDGEKVAGIGRGYLVLLGVGHEDTKETADKLVKKLAALRINEDENGKTNLSIRDIGGELLVVSQFTLFAVKARGDEIFLKFVKFLSHALRFRLMNPAQW